ncbi:hypothetical protein [Methanotorris igneus]|uniref:Cell division protein ZapB n=1 Tax=Methanotorris igneus (strain DSM 5666 / JCM 11834 / Kol 5) TaxID=880724 RepID=F6BBY8_METIK|nr:hypothetical protein [Methanotorris igneus]AEF96069.1 hypothetical protein Metig_0513 [Methanotorris igneus Kol 5]
MGMGVKSILDEIRRLKRENAQLIKEKKELQKMRDELYAMMVEIEEQIQRNNARINKLIQEAKEVKRFGAL